MSSPLLALAPLLAARWRPLAAGVLGLSVASACNIAAPILAAEAIDIDLAAHDRLGLIRRSLSVAAAVAVAWVSTLLAKLALETTVQKSLADLKAKLFDHLLSLDATFHDQTPSGSLIGRVSGDVEALRILLVEVLFALPADMILALGMLAALQQRAPAIAGPVFASIPLYLLLFVLFRIVAPPLFQRQRSYVSRVTASLAETSRALPALGAIGRQRWATDRAAALVRESWRADVIANLQPIWYFNAASALRTLATSGLLLWGSAAISEGRATVGTLLLAISYLRQIFQPLMRLSDHLSTLERARASAVRVETLLSTRSALVEPERPVPWPGLSREITFERVDFSYREGTPVLRSLDLSIPAGSRLGIVGPTGSGKSTLIDLLLRLRDPVAGRVCIDGTDIRQISLSEIRARTALVLQDVQLIPGTVLENLGCDEVSALRALGAVGLPWPLDRAVSDASLSRGERQMLTLARALASSPSLIVLDEATSAIDPSTEATLEEVLDRIAREGAITVVIVAHRLRTVRRCDRIVVLQDGAIEESGDHLSLLERGGIYAELVRKQSAGAA